MAKQTTTSEEINSYYHVIEVVKDYSQGSEKEPIFKAGDRFKMTKYKVEQWCDGKNAPLWYYTGGHEFQVSVPREYCRLLRIDTKRVITTDETVAETEC